MDIGTFYDACPAAGWGIRRGWCRGEGSQQTNIVPAAEQHDGSSKGSGAINNETKEPTSTSEEGGQNNETAPPSGTLGTPTPSGEEQNGKDETLTPTVGGGETKESESNPAPIKGEGGSGSESESNPAPTEGEGGSEGGNPSEVEYAATIGETQFTSLADAITAIKTEPAIGKTITLLRNVKENITIDTSLTLDLAGFTLEAEKDGSPVISITGSDTEVTVTSSAEGKGVITGGNNPSNGGGFSIQDATVSLHNLSITENKAIGDGGGVTGGGGIYAKGAKHNLGQCSHL